MLLESAKLHGNIDLQNVQMVRLSCVTIAAGIWDLHTIFYPRTKMFCPTLQSKFLGALLGSGSTGPPKLGTIVTEASSLPKNTKKNMYREINYSDATAGHFKLGLQN